MPIALVRAGVRPARYAVATVRRQSAKRPTSLLALEELQVDTAREVGRFRRELDDRDPGVTGGEVGRRRVDAIRDPLEGGPEPVAVRLVPQDRRREVQDEDHVGPFRRLRRLRRPGAGHGETSCEQDPYEKSGDGRCPRTEASQIATPVEFRRAVPTRKRMSRSPGPCHRLGSDPSRGFASPTMTCANGTFNTKRKY